MHVLAYVKDAKIDDWFHNFMVNKNMYMYVMQNKKNLQDYNIC